MLCTLLPDSFSAGLGKRRCSDSRMGRLLHIAYSHGNKLSVHPERDLNAFPQQSRLGKQGHSRRPEEGEKSSVAKPHWEKVFKPKDLSWRQRVLTGQKRSQKELLPIFWFLGVTWARAPPPPPFFPISRELDTPWSLKI